MAKKRKELVILSALLCALALFGLGGCQPADPDPDAPTSGGTTDRTDYDAPKEIKSKDISVYYATFFLTGEWRPGIEGDQFTFEIKDDGNGVLTAYENSTGISSPADDALLAAMQGIIDEYELVQRNGVYRVTAGLPPEFQDCTLTVDYASGEHLTFTTNNNPDEKWIQQTYLTFANWFAEKGDDTLLPPKRTEKVVKMRYHFKDNGILTEYGGINVQEENAIDGETYLLEKDVYDMEKEETLEWKFVKFPEDYYEQINKIISHYDLSAYDHYSVYYWMNPLEEEDEPQLAALQLHLKYESGQQIHIDTNNAEVIDALRPLLADIAAYQDALFE